MAHLIPFLAVSVLMHAGHRQVAFPTYLSRLLVVLLAFAVLAVGTYWCLDVVAAVGTTAKSAGDAEGADR